MKKNLALTHISLSIYVEKWAKFYQKKEIFIFMSFLSIIDYFLILVKVIIEMYAMSVDLKYF